MLNKIGLKQQKKRIRKEWEAAITIKKAFVICCSIIIVIEPPASSLLYYNVPKAIQIIHKWH